MAVVCCVSNSWYCTMQHCMRNLISLLMLCIV